METTSPGSGYFHALDSSLFRSTRQFLGYVHPDPPCEFAVLACGQANDARSAQWPPVMPSDARWCPVDVLGAWPIGAGLWLHPEAPSTTHSLQGGPSGSLRPGKTTAKAQLPRRSCGFPSPGRRCGVVGLRGAQVPHMRMAMELILITMARRLVFPLRTGSLCHHDCAGECCGSLRDRLAVCNDKYWMEHWALQTETT